MRIAGVGKAFAAVPGKESVDIPQARKITHKPLTAALWALAARGKILLPEQILVRNHCRAHRPVLMRPRAMQQSILLPQRKAHPLII